MVSSTINSQDFSLNQLDKIKKYLVTITENESERSAKELHDDLGQQIVLIKLLFETYSSKSSKDNFLENEIKNCIKSLYDQLKYSIDKKTISNKKNYNILDFVNEQKSKIELIKPNFLHIYFSSNNCKNYFKKLSKETSLNLIRIIQEFIANTLKHSNASGISLSFFITNNRFFLMMSDNGIGFSMNKVHKGNGLKNIEWRLQLMESKFCFESNSNGTSLFLEI